MRPPYQQQAIPLILATISQPRLSSYRRFFSPRDDSELYGLYCWNDAISQRFFRTLALTEIAIRNQFHTALSTQYGVVGGPGSKDWYNFLALNKISADKIKSVTHRKSHGTYIPRMPAPSPDDVVSKLTFGFWPHLLDTARDALGAPVPWNSLLPQILPGHRQRHPTYWATQAAQDALFARIDLCNGLRNRIAHHEPLWKAGDLHTESRFRSNRPLTVVAPTPTTVTDALVRLNLVYSRTMELMQWLSPALASSHVVSDAYISFKGLATQSAVDTFKMLRPVEQFDLGDFKTLRNMKKTLKRTGRHGIPAEFRHNQSLLGYWISPI
jgi:hypothetical protein